MSDLDTFVEHLSTRRRGKCLPAQIRTQGRKFIHDVLALLYPHFAEKIDCNGDRIKAELTVIETTLANLISDITKHVSNANPHPVSEFVDQLPSILLALDLDAQAIFSGDPAAESLDEVILAYPGFYAIAVYRIAHALTRLEVPLLPRILAEQAHHSTGVDIHPKAQIGRSFTIDHATGIVIGETAEIGNGVKLYQGVTLGALSVQKSLAKRKRHPTLGDNVVVYANATILGGETMIGHDSVVGANAWITESVPPFSVVGRHSEARPRKESKDSLEYNI